MTTGIAKRRVEEIELFLRSFRNDPVVMNEADVAWFEHLEAEQHRLSRKARARVAA